MTRTIPVPLAALVGLVALLLLAVVAAVEPSLLAHVGGGVSVAAFPAFLAGPIKKVGAGSQVTFSLEADAAMTVFLSTPLIEAIPDGDGTYAADEEAYDSWRRFLAVVQVNPNNRGDLIKANAGRLAGALPAAACSPRRAIARRTPWPSVELTAGETIEVVVEMPDPDSAGEPASVAVAFPCLVHDGGACGVGPSLPAAAQRGKLPGFIVASELTDVGPYSGNVNRVNVEVKPNVDGIIDLAQLMLGGALEAPPAASGPLQVAQGSHSIDHWLLLCGLVDNVGRQYIRGNVGSGEVKGMPNPFQADASHFWSSLPSLELPKGQAITLSVGNACAQTIQASAAAPFYAQAPSGKLIPPC